MVALGPRVVERDIELTVGVDRGLNERCDLRGGGDVGLHEDGVATGVTNLLSDGLTLGLAPRADRNLGTFPSESQSRRLADARAASGDHGHLAVELVRHCSSPE